MGERERGERRGGGGSRALAANAHQMSHSGVSKVEVHALVRIDFKETCELWEKMEVVGEDLGMNEIK